MKRIKINGKFVLDEEGNVGTVSDHEKYPHMCTRSAITLSEFLRIHGTEIKEPVTYKITDKFLVDHRMPVVDKYMLAQVAPNMACLVGLETGNRLKNPVEVRNIYAITDEEFNKILGGYKAFVFKDDEMCRVHENELTKIGDSE